MNEEQRTKIVALLESEGMEELHQTSKKGVYTKNKIPHMWLVDLNKTQPEICVSDGVSRISEGHGIETLYLLKTRIENILKAGTGKDDVHKTEKPKTPEKSAREDKTDADVAQDISEKTNGAAHVKKPATTPAEAVHTEKQVTTPAGPTTIPCEKCGAPVDKVLAKKHFEDDDMKVLCNDCRSGKNKLVASPSTVMAKQYGIPQEIANMYFMELNGSLYIKNPGLLYLASKQGYSRIEITDHYDEESETWEATCKIYPTLTKELFEGVAKLDASLQKQAFDFVTQPTNGTGKANKGNVKMKTMWGFLRELAQTRAANRALRNYTGYGGTSMEELPNAELVQG